MIATAIEINSFIAPLSSRFGKAKYYAFFDGESIKIEENPHESGTKLLLWLLEKGVTMLLIKEVNRKPCAIKKSHKVHLLYPSSDNQSNLKEMVRLYYQEVV